MTDLALRLSNGGEGLDLAVVNNDLATDDGLQTAIFLSLFCNARADDDDELPAGITDRGGWWGDRIETDATDSTGSTLWLFAREKLTEQTASRIREACATALKWLTGDGVAQSVDVQTEIAAGGLLKIQIDVTKPNIAPVRFTYNYNWAAQALMT